MLEVYQSVGNGVGTHIQNGTMARYVIIFCIILLLSYRTRGLNKESPVCKKHLE